MLKTMTHADFPTSTFEEKFAAKTRQLSPNKSFSLRFTLEKSMQQSCTFEYCHREQLSMYDDLGSMAHEVGANILRHITIVASMPLDQQHETNKRKHRNEYSSLRVSN